MSSTFLERYQEGFSEYPSDILSPIADPRNEFYGLHKSKTYGGVAIGDTSEPLNKYIWDGEYDKDTGSFSFWRRDLGKNTKTTVFEGKKDILSIDFCFDQNMRAFISYEQNYQSYYWHFNAENSTYDEVKLENATRFPRCCLYTAQPYSIPDSDVIIAYIRNNKLLFRVQRERFLKEYLIKEDPKKTMLWKFWFSSDGRVIFQWR